MSKIITAANNQFILQIHIILARVRNGKSSECLFMLLLPKFFVVFRDDRLCFPPTNTTDTSKYLSQPVSSLSLSLSEVTQMVGRLLYTFTMHCEWLLTTETQVPISQA